MKATDFILNDAEGKRIRCIGAIAIYRFRQGHTVYIDGSYIFLSLVPHSSGIDETAHKRIMPRYNAV
jgi:hypothetical protein